MEGEGEWTARKHGGKRRVWRKIRIGLDAQTLDIRAADVTASDVGDAPMLPDVLDQIPPDQEIASVTADGAFAARSAAAILPARRTKRWKPDTPGAFGIALGPMAVNASPRTEALRPSRRHGRKIRAVGDCLPRGA